MKYFDKTDIGNFNKIHRINLMNSLSGYKSANLLGTVSNEGFENLAVFSSIVHLGSNPPVLGFILRPTTVPRNTYENIINTGYYTVNHIAQEFTAQAHHTSAKYDKEISEFEMSGLTPIYKKDFHAPFVKESPVQIGLQFLEENYIKANDTILVVGEIQCFYVNENMYDQKDGFLDLTKGNVATINGLDAYAVPSNNTRYSYQRPKILKEEL